MLGRRIYGDTWGLKPDMIYGLYTVVNKLMLRYSLLICWPEMKEALTGMAGCRLASLGIAVAMRTIPTIADIWNLPLLYFVKMGDEDGPV